MKTRCLFLSTVTLMLLSITSCEERNELIYLPPPTKPPSTVFPGGGGGYLAPINMSAFKSICQSVIETNFSTTNEYMGKYENFVYINYERFIREDLMELNSYFQIPSINLNSFARDLISSINTIQYTEEYIDVMSIPGGTSYINLAQMVTLNSYFNNMLNATSVESANSYYQTAKSSIENSTRLTFNEKVTMLGMIEHANLYAEGYFSGKTSEVVLDINSQMGASATSNGSCIRWRDVWRSAVIGGVAGGASGAFVGATGGTVALPGVGTVGGGVAGAVFGFAGGFAGGAISSVTAQYLFNCLLKSPRTAPDTRCDDPNFFNRNWKYCMEPKNDHKLWYIFNGVNPG